MSSQPQAAPVFSVGIIARRRIPQLDRVVSQLTTLEGPYPREIIVAVETPGADQPSEHADENGVRWLAIPASRGLAYNRNRVLEAAHGEFLLHTDDDCELGEGWIVSLLAALTNPDIVAAAGQARVAPGGFLGDSISALGFPAGGSAGYETMFPVAKDGTTTNITTCSCALRVSELRAIGGFNESMTQGGEDTELAHRFTEAGKKILFVPEASVVHPARTSLTEFTRWFYRRGKAKRQFARLVPVSGYVKNRIASYGRILRAHLTDPKIVLIFPLLIASVLLQQAGFIAETIRPSGVQPGG